MIGRAAIGNPWIFQRRDRDDVPWEERLPVVLQHLESMLVFHGPTHGLHRFRKHLHGYVTQGWFTAMVSIANVDMRRCRRFGGISAEFVECDAVILNKDWWMSETQVAVLETKSGQLDGLWHISVYAQPWNKEVR